MPTLTTPLLVAYSLLHSYSGGQPSVRLHLPLQENLNKNLNGDRNRAACLHIYQPPYIEGHLSRYRASYIQWAIYTQIYTDSLSDDAAEAMGEWLLLAANKYGLEGLE